MFGKGVHQEDAAGRADPCQQCPGHGAARPGGGPHRAGALEVGGAGRTDVAGCT